MRSRNTVDPYTTLPVPDTFWPIIETLERLMRHEWKMTDAHQRNLRRRIIVWALFTTDTMTGVQLAQHLGVSKQGITFKVRSVEIVLDRLHALGVVHRKIEEPDDHDTIIDDRMHATHMIVSREDHAYIEDIEYRERNLLRRRYDLMAQGKPPRWYGADDPHRGFGHVNEARLQREWYDRVSVPYWYDPASKTVYQRA